MASLHVKVVVFVGDAMNARPKTLAIAVTGGIGSGKSEVCKIFASMGAKVLHADIIAKEIISRDASVRRQIRKVFGPQSFDASGSLDRQRIAEDVFSNRGLRKSLERIVHPRTLQKIKNEIRREKQSGKYPLVVVEAALLYEAGADVMFDFVVDVSTSIEEAIRRVIGRDMATRQDVRRRMDSQMSSSTKALRADFVLHNNGDLQLLERNCRFLFGLLATMNPSRGGR